MPNKKYRIRLTTDEQQELQALVSRGRTAAYKQTHARIVLMSDEERPGGGMKDADIASALGVGQSTVERIRKRCVEEGIGSALNRIVLVMDNPVSSTGQALNTHKLSSLYEAFEPAEARRIAERLEIHYTPKHGSWLNPVLSLPKGWRR